MAYWLMKSEPDSFSIDDLRSAGQAPWDGVRNYQARNFMRNMQPRDSFLFYHSSCKPPGIAGIGEIVSEPYPDRAALDPENPYHDAKASEDRLPWVAVNVTLSKKFPTLLALADIKQLNGLDGLPLLHKGNRLSVMPVTPQQWAILTAAT
ncbi:MAG TPA: EVE domain-containing protein [Pseudomonas sabulinigri]|uniref:EVE domain-containing protein n=1 Tax=marine sediment metagenome TaxID=412755 RepID=A0A0F9Y892_9ZZZZ|nr:EVE domain-containing protein [Halopseudomonas sabulinigri]HEC51812.1 EVE domain-containing protein [Halopseudomonas sabulinigri]|tara:strand:+ start:973 stop:1422 length:450 start_codon:yes stop_codon:yes gene_type:complete